MADGTGPATSDERSARRDEAVRDLRGAIPMLTPEDWAWHAIERLKQLDRHDLVVLAAKLIREGQE